MGGGVAQGEERVELLQPLPGLLALHRLGLVDDQDGVGPGNDVDGAAGTELVQLHVDAPGVLAPGVEGLGVDDHHVDGAVGGKAVDLRQLGGVVDEEADLLAILLREMLLCHLKGLVHALPDGHAGHHHDKLAPAVVPVQLVHGLDVGVGLTHAGLHFDGEIVPALQPGRGGNLVGPLDLVQVLQHHLVAELRDDGLVAPAGEAHRLQGELVRVGAPVHPIGGGQVGLPGEHIHHGLGGVSLKFLVFELEFHTLHSLELINF